MIYEDGGITAETKGPMEAGKVLEKAKNMRKHLC